MYRCMIDLETRGTKPGCTILSIGAVFFCERTRKLGPTFYTTIRQESCKQFGLQTDPATLAWWHGQSLAAKKVLTETAIGGQELDRALLHFKEWMEGVQFNDWVYVQLEEGAARPKDWLANVEIWGCGAAFDNTILAAAYHAVGQPLPWKFWNDRCYRTLKALYPECKFNRVGTYHNALDDARSQALHAIDLLRAAKRLPEPNLFTRAKLWLDDQWLRAV